ncbi:hypothetical protein TSMEX_011048 [Taenia solium]|eukprot:TsM_000659500 transcript=TsM_000659500 gene=TsM_000659500
MLYKVCVRNCHPKLATAVAAPPSFAGARVVSSGDLFEVATIVGTEKYICSNAVCGSVPLPVKAPSNVDVTVLSPNAVNVSWELPIDSDGMDVYNAYANGFEEKCCRGKAGDLQCRLADLLPSTTYKFCVQICHAYSSAPIYQSSARTASFYSTETLLGSPKDSTVPKLGSNAGGCICGPPLCISATTPSDNRLLKILLGIFIPLIIILLLVLLYIFRKRIPFFKHWSNKESPVDHGEARNANTEFVSHRPLNRVDKMFRASKRTDGESGGSQ